MNDTFRPPPSWPKVIGGISIGWGVLGLLCGGCGLGFLSFGKGMLPAEMKDMPSMNPTTGTYAQMGVSFLWALLLIGAGAITLGRNPIGRILHLVYAVGALPLFFVGLMIQIDANERNRVWMQAHPEFAGPGASSPIGETIGYAIGAFFGLAYPIFLLVWFLAIKYRKDDMLGSPIE